jgi:hypothetical protein
MKSRFILVPCLLFLAVAPGAAAGDGDDDKEEAKRIVIQVERIRRMKPEEQKKEIEHLYRTLAARLRELNRYALAAALRPDLYKGRDDMAPDAWVEKAWGLSPDAFTYLLYDTRATNFALLKKHRSELKALLLADLASPSRDKLEHALYVVREIGAGKEDDTELFDAVLHVFENNAASASAAGGALRGLGDPRAIAPLVKRHPDLVAVFEILRTLQRQCRADPVLVALLDAKDAEVRWRAAYALSESGDPELIGRIEKLLRDPDPRVRQNAANMGFCLEKAAYERIKPALVALGTDPDLAVRTYAVRWLAHQRDPACGPALLELARDAKLNQREHYDVVRWIHDLTGSTFGYDTSDAGWRPTTATNQAALARFAEWVAKRGK